MKTQTYRILLLGALGVFAVGPTMAIDYMGCGSLATSVICEGCTDVSGSCSCTGGNCAQTKSECSSEANAWIQCSAPNKGNDIYRELSKYQRRNRCNNSAGEDLGPCATTCTQSAEWVYFGADRTIYTKAITKCNCP